MDFASLTAEKIEPLMAHLHKEAVFTDSGILALAVIEEIQIGPQMFRVRLRLTEVLLFREMAGPDFKREGTVGAAWPYMNIEGERWSSSVQGASWALLASEPSVAEVALVALRQVGPRSAARPAKSCALACSNVTPDPPAAFRLAALASTRRPDKVSAMW